MSRHRPTARRLLALVAAAAALLTVAACGDSGPTTLDMAQATNSIAGFVTQNYGVYQPSKPTCPASEPVAKGTTFECTATIAGATLHIKVTEQDDSGTQINFVAVEAVLNATSVANDLARQVVDQFTGKVTVDCGTVAALVVAPGSSVDCTGSDEVGATKPIHVLVSDAVGHYTVTVG